MTRLTLSTITNAFPVTDAECGAAEGALRLLCSTPASPDVADRAAAVIDVFPDHARLIGETPGAQGFLLPMTSTDAEAAVVSLGGRVTFLAQGESVEISDPDNCPELYGRLTCRLAQNHGVYFGGMSRQLYRFDLPLRRWERLDEGVRDDMMDSDFFGLSSFGDNGLLAVGGGGEIWAREQDVWCQIDSSTTMMLNAVERLDAGRSIICGVAGTLILMTQEGATTPIPHAMGERFLSSVVRFRDVVFVLGQGEIHAFSNDAAPRYLGVIDKGNGVTRLVAAPDCLWAIGPKSLGRTTDGVSWRWLACDDLEVRINTGFNPAGGL